MGGGQTARLYSRQPAATAIQRLVAARNVGSLTAAPPYADTVIVGPQEPELLTQV